MRKIQQATNVIDPNVSIEFFLEEQITEEPTATLTESDILSNSKAFVSPNTGGSNLVSPRAGMVGQMAIRESTN